MIMNEIVAFRSDRLRELRKRAGFNQESLAVILDIRQGHISNMEKGGDVPSVPLLIKLAKSLDTSTDYLLGLTDDDGLRDISEREVYAAVKSPEARELIQEIVDILRQKDDSELPFYVNTLKLLLNGGKPPRIVGGE